MITNTLFIDVYKRQVNNIITALGVRFGVDGNDDSKKANIDKLRYHKVVIMTCLLYTSL